MDPAGVAKVAVAAAVYSIDRPYDYVIPAALQDRAKVGVRVMVPFGRGNRASAGIILSLAPESKRQKLKALTEVLDEESVLSPEQLRLAMWLRDRYFCTLYDAVRAILPVGLWYRVREVCTLQIGPEEAQSAALDSKESRVLEALVSHGGTVEMDTICLDCGREAAAVARALARRGVLSIAAGAQRQIQDKWAQRVSLAVSPEEALAMVEPKRRTAPLRYAVVQMLCEAGSVMAHDVRYFTGASGKTLRGLEKSGIVCLTQEEVLRVPQFVPVDGAPIALSQEQQAVYDGILARADAGKADCVLLYGVTGSGKTLVYMRLLQEMVRRGKRGMVLVPEIALTPQIMARFTACFGNRVALLHSGLSVSERYDQWKRVRRGEVDVVLGTRSAVFAPLREIGMIILDEEHDSSYQSELSPCYHARDVAKFLCAQQKAVLVLGSATPSIESTYQAQKGVYQKQILRNRYNQRPLPRVQIADMRREIRAGNAGMISAPLRTELAENLNRGEQSILFLNRRGNSRVLLCGECGAAPRCPRCSVFLTYHSANGRMMCHYCGHSEKAPVTCPECGGIMRRVGPGTQKVEEELGKLFPGTAVLRMDADTATGKQDRLLEKFDKEKIPILLGTQMVAKGLDFENVTLVGVLAADLGLYVDDYRSAEKTFNLLTQVVGRAGRGDKDGRAIVQTYTPDNEVITSAAAQDYNSFYISEIRLRKLRRYPPFADIFTLTVSGQEERSVLRAAAGLREALRETARVQALRDVEVLGPAPAHVLKISDRYRYCVLWVGHNDRKTRELLAYYLREFQKRKENRKTALSITCNS